MEERDEDFEKEQQTIAKPVWERSNGEREDKEKKDRLSAGARLLGEQRRFSLGDQRRDTISSSPPPSSPRNSFSPFSGAGFRGSLEREESFSELIATGDNFLRSLITSFRRLMGANKQLCVVSRYATDGVNGKKEELKILRDQLIQAKENLEEANNELSEKLRRAARVQTHQVVMDLILFSVTISNTASFLINSCKAVTIEVGDRELFKQVMTATRTVRDALLSVAESLKDAPAQQQNSDMEKRLQQAAATAKQSLWQLIIAQAAVTGENLISSVRKQEILAATRAAVCATTKLVWVRSGGLDPCGGSSSATATTSATSTTTTTTTTSTSSANSNSNGGGAVAENVSGGGGEIVEAAKIAATTVSQLSAALLEAANSDLMIAHPPYQQVLLQGLDRLKAALRLLLEETRTEVFVDPRKISPAFEEMREAIINAAAVTDMLSQQSLAQLGNEVPALTRKHVQDAKKIVENNAPPPPAQPPLPSEQPTTSEGPKDSSATINIWEEPPDSSENVRVREDDGRIRCANLNKLIEKLTPPGSPDMKMIKAFVTTYQSFTTAHELIKKLIERFTVPQEFAEIELPIQLRVCNFLRLWVERYLADFDNRDIKLLTRFVESKLTQNTKYEKYARKIQVMLHMRRASNIRETVRKGLVDIKVEPKIPLSPAKVLSVFDELQIARQLTLVEFNLYRAIRPVELLQQAWNKPKLKYRAPNLLRLIARSTSLSMWVASCILWQPTLRERIRVLTKMMNIAEHLRKMNNFNSLMAVIAGINTSSIYRLKHTRDGVSPSVMKTFEACEALMSSNESFKNYRKELHHINPPCVPFVGVYLTDLTFADDANPDYIDGLINFGKWELIYGIIAEIQQYQQTPYDFEYVDHIASFLSELPQNTEDDMFNLSKAYEPKDSALSEIL